MEDRELTLREFIIIVVLTLVGCAILAAMSS